MSTRWPSIGSLCQGAWGAGYVLATDLTTPNWDAGFGGMTLSFVDYTAELACFAQDVLPRLEKLGVRMPC